jgi:hypothetical protein
VNAVSGVTGAASPAFDVSARAQPSLGTIAKFAATNDDARKIRAERWGKLRNKSAWLFMVKNKKKLQAEGQGADLLPPTTDLGYHRVCFCNWSVVGRWAYIDGERKRLGDDVAVSYSPVRGRSTFKGVMTCGSWSACPICGGFIAERRRKELAQLLVIVRERGCIPALLVLTQHHKKEDLIGDLVARLDGDRRRMMKTREYKRLVEKYGVLIDGRRRLHFVGGPETTCGYNGFNYHWQGAYILAPGSDAGEFEREYRDLWYRVRGYSFLAPGPSGELVAADMNAWQYGCKVSSKEGDLAEYVSKFGRLPNWDIAEEVALSFRKRGRDGYSKHYTMMELLELSAAGDHLAGEVWVEWAVAMKGKSSLRFSPGLLGWAGMKSVTDEEIVEDTSDYLVDLAFISKGLWSVIRGDGRGGGDLRSELLTVADSGDQGAVRRWLEVLQRRGFDDMENSNSSVGYAGELLDEGELDQGEKYWLLAVPELGHFLLCYGRRLGEGQRLRFGSENEARIVLRDLIARRGRPRIN